MTIGSGSRLGPYEVSSRIGAGGMGEIWRAKDTRLDRDVAIKVLPAIFASDAQLKIRFEREAKTISSLNHPHICTLHDVGHDSGIDYLVMEMIEGESLADRLKKGRLPLDQVLRIGAEIAEALHAAHGRGIVHRDLKPGNIMLTKSGAKLLDFGLAKSSSDAPVIVEATGLVTEAKPLTREGMILGTFQYMAPEQFEGVDADAQTDIFALGVVLYEMATGRRAFEGKTRTSLIAAIVSGEPQPVTDFAPEVPGALEHVIRKCLEKMPENRWHSAHDVASELRWIGSRGSELSVPPPRRRKWLASGGALLAAAAGVLIGAASMKMNSPRPAVLRAGLLAPAPAQFALRGDHNGSVAISPDSKLIVTAMVSEVRGSAALWLRPVGASNATKINGTENATFPFWSPDGKYIGFFSDGKLKKVDLTGAPPVTVCAAAAGRGGTWNRDGTILFAPAATSGLLSVSAGGGEPKIVTRLDDRAGETTHRAPWFLPDGKHFLYFAGSHAALSGVSDSGAVWIGSLDGSERKKLFDASSQAVFADGHLFFVRDGILLAQRFDEDAQALKGNPLPVSGNVTLERRYFRSVFAVSDGGLLLYQTAGGIDKGLIRIFDRKGVLIFGSAQPDVFARYNLLSVSPKGRLLFSLEDSESRTASLWTLETERGTRTRVTFGKATDNIAVWSPDGTKVAFAREEGKPWVVMTKDLESAANEEVVWASEGKTGWPTTWSPDGRVIGCSVQDAKGSRDIVMVPIDGGKPRDFLASPAYNEYNPFFSPDGKWISYVSNETGRPEIFAVTWPEGRAKQQITNGDLGSPAIGYWHEDGITYYSSDMTVKSVNVRRGERSLEMGTPQVLFKAEDLQTFAVSADGSRIALVVPDTRAEEKTQRGLDLVMNWQELVRDSGLGGK